MEIDLNNKKVVISRTDSIGDVMLTLPICVWLKYKYPDIQLLFLGRSYTKPVVECFSVINEFYDWSEIERLPTMQRADIFKKWNADVILHVFPRKEIAALAKKAKIAIRVGTSHRSYHLLTCNERINFTRKKSSFHESQLNFELLRPFGIEQIPDATEIEGYVSAFKINRIVLPDFITSHLEQKRKKVILHPKSQGSAVEWPIEKYLKLATILAKKEYTVFFTGTEKEGEKFRDLLPKDKFIVDTSGKLTLDELIYFISEVDALVACSTGPLHIAGISGIRTVGLFSPKKPIHPGRWRPLGTDVRVIINDELCENCRKKKKCDCIEEIEVEKVLSALN